MKVLPLVPRRASQAVATEAPRVLPLFSRSAAPTLPPRCIHCEAPASFFLCDEAGKPQPHHAGGLCRACRPIQYDEEPTPSIGTPATLAAVEAASKGFATYGEAHSQRMRELRIERDVLAQDLANMLAHSWDTPYSPNGPTDDEIRDAKQRLIELDDLLIFDEPRQPIAGFDYHPPGSNDPAARSGRVEPRFWHLRARVLQDAISPICGGF